MRFYKEVEGIKEPHPCQLFHKFLFSKIKKWQSKCEELILVIDAKEDVYKGLFAEHLVDIGVEMTCAYKKIHKQRIWYHHPTSQAAYRSWASL